MGTPVPKARGKPGVSQAKNFPVSRKGKLHVWGREKREEQEEKNGFCFRKVRKRIEGVSRWLYKGARPQRQGAVHQGPNAGHP